MAFHAFLYHKDFPVLLDAHLLQEHVHDDKRYDGKQFLIFLDGIYFEDDERFREQGSVHVLVQYFVVVAAFVERLYHVGIFVVVYLRDVVFQTDKFQPFTGVFIEGIERQRVYFQGFPPFLQQAYLAVHLLFQFRQVLCIPSAFPLLGGYQGLVQVLALHGVVTVEAVEVSVVIVRHHLLYDAELQFRDFRVRPFPYQ